MTRTLKLASVFGVACSLLIMPRISLAEGGGVDIAGTAGSAVMGTVGTVSDIGGSIVGGAADIAGSALQGAVGTVSNIGSSIVGGAADIAGMAGSALMGTVGAVSNIAGTGLLSIGKVISDVSSLMVGWPVLDLASVPAHAIVSIEQEFIRMRTEIEDETKQQIKERLSATKNNIG